MLAARSKTDLTAKLLTEILAIRKKLCKQMLQSLRIPRGYSNRVAAQARTSAPFSSNRARRMDRWQCDSSWQ